LLPWGRTDATEAEPGPLSDKQVEILSELESRWWGWRSEPSPVVPAPKSWKLLGETWRFSAREEVVVLIEAEPSPQIAYIAQMLRRELAGKHKLPCRIARNVKDVKTANPVICLGTIGGDDEVARLLRQQGIDPKSLGRPESYILEFLAQEPDKKRWILVGAGDPVGCIHGGYSLMQLIHSDDGKVTVDACRVRDYPTVAVRSLRGIGESLGMKLQVHTESRYFDRKITADEVHPDELVIPCLDWLARNRINGYHILSGLHNGPKLPERMRYLVEESHRRGIKVVGGFRPVGAQQGDRSTFPCYCDERHMQIVLGHIRQYIEAGCDFVYFMADDYYRDKLDGHCDKCIARFDDLAGEQIHMLHRIVDVAHELGMSNEQILFCPTHYDVGRVGDDAVSTGYLKAFNDDPKLRGIQFTFTYLAEEVIEERKQSLPNLTYALFYNGPRWLAYYGHSSANTRSVLGNHARNAMYFPIYYGWHVSQYDPTEGWFVNTTEQVRRTFHEVVPRETGNTTLLGNIANYSDSIFKGPVEYALWGHYCWNPETHDTRQSEAVIARHLFGPAGGRTLPRLNRVLIDLTRVVYEGVAPPQDFLDTITDRFKLAKLLHRRLAEGYESHVTAFAPDDVPPAQEFHARLGIEDIERYIAKMEHVVHARGLLSGGPAAILPSPRYAGVIFPSADPEALLISGGCRGGNLTGCLADLWKHHTEENRWEQLKAPAEIMSPRCGHSAVTVGERVFFFGGTGNSFLRVHNSLHEFDIRTESFRQITDTRGGPPPERLVHAATGDNQGRLWIYGGLTTDRQPLDDLWCYHPAENRWEEIAEADGDLPGERYGTRMVHVDDALYLFGGKRHHGPLLDDLYRFEPRGRRWTLLDPEGADRPSPRYAHAFISTGKRVLLFGGSGKEGFVNDLWVYDCNGDRWEQLAPKGEVPGPRGCPLPLCMDNNRLYLFSGSQSIAAFGSWVNGDLYRYDIAENKFSKLHESVVW